jgi:hypothetical protein
MFKHVIVCVLPAECLYMSLLSLITKSNKFSILKVGLRNEESVCLLWIRKQNLYNARICTKLHDQSFKHVCLCLLWFCPWIERSEADCKTTKDFSFEEEAAFKFIKPSGYFVWHKIPHSGHILYLRVWYIYIKTVPINPQKIKLLVFATEELFLRGMDWKFT